MCLVSYNRYFSGCGCNYTAAKRQVQTEQSAAAAAAAAAAAGRLCPLDCLFLFLKDRVGPGSPLWQDLSASLETIQRWPTSMQ